MLLVRFLLPFIALSLLEDAGTFKVGLGPQVNFCGTTLTDTQTIKIYYDTYFNITEKIKIFIVSLAHLYSSSFTNLLYKMLT